MTSVHPYGVHEKRRRARRRWVFRVFGAGILGACGLSVLAWVLLWSPLMRFKEFKMIGMTALGEARTLRTGEENLRAYLYAHAARTFLGIPSDNFFAWPKDFTDSTPEEFSRIQGVFFERDYGTRTLVAHVREREAVGVWCVETGTPSCYWFDREGVLFEEGIRAEGSLLTLVRDYSGTEKGFFSQVFPHAKFEVFMEILEVFRLTGVRPGAITVPEAILDEVHVSLPAGPTLLFSLRFPPEATASALREIAARDDFSSLATVDFRVENRVYFK